MNLLNKVLTLWTLTASAFGLENLYDVLGVKRSDSQAKIKKAFREQALKWHPDRNKDPNAEEEMIKINHAFQILSDPEKRKKYDNFGTVDDGNHKQWTADDIFQQFRGPGGQYSFMFEDMPFGSFFNTHEDQNANALNDYNYKNIVIPDSYHKPFLIYVLSDICFDCLKVKKLWASLCENFETIGIGTYELNYHRQRRLYDEVGANRTPQFIVVVKGRKIKYKGDMTERGVREFISTVLPHNLIDQFEDEKEYFEQSFVDNKPQVLLFSRHMYPPLLYQVVAFEYHNKVKFAYIYTKDRKTSRLCKKYNVAPDQPTVLILKEEPSSPVVVARGTALKRGTLRKLVTSNLHFFVPRLTSNELIDELCPKKYASSRTLCYILMVEKNTNFNTHLWKLREYAKNEEFLKEKRAQFLYVYTNVQKEFVESFTEGSKDYMVPCSDGSLPLKLLVLWRQQNDKVKYDWYTSGWCKDSGKEELYEFIDDRASNAIDLQHETADIGKLKDEHWHGHAWDAVKMIYKWVQDIVDSFEHPSWTNPASVFILLMILLIVCIGFIMPYVGEMNIGNDGPELPRHTSGEVSTTVLGLTKFDFKNQKELLHNSPPGTMTIAVLVDTIEIDQVAQSPLIQAFADITFPYSMNATHKFVWLSLAENLVWCNDLINSNKFGEFPPGCVIAFNGFRKSFYIYRPNIGGAHPELSADFLGFEESDDEGFTDVGQSSLERAKVKRAALKMREELACWLDRLLEGTLRDKKRIDKWPEIEPL